MERGEMERHRYPTIADRVGWWVSEWPVLSRLALIVLVSVVGIVLVLTAQAVYASGNEQTTVTLPLASFLGIIFGLISLLVSGPVAWIIRGVMRDLKNINENHEKLKEKVLTEFVSRRDHDTASARLETRIESMNTDLGVKLDRIFELVGDLERNKADKHAFGHAVG